MEIASGGTFKYVLLDLTLNGVSKRVVRGEDKEYHKGVKQSAERRLNLDLRNKGIVVKCPGGGRIRHISDSNPPSILVYGYSNAYGQGDHAFACELIRKAYPQYGKDQISWSNEGY